MWCFHCRQDVPALASAEGQFLRCPRCGRSLDTEPAHDARAAPAAGFAEPREGQAPTSAACELPLPFDDWELDEQLRHIERVLQAAKTQVQPIDMGRQRQTMHCDAAHTGLPAWHVPLAERHRQGRPKPNNGSHLLWGLVTWSALLLGTAGLVCGCSLLAWSLTEGPAELWNIGLPVAAVGQVALLVGLVLQVDGLWHHSHQTVAKLDSVDEQLYEIRASATLLGAGQSSTAGTFYAHLAHGAGPQLLLTDLKSQLDLLALKIAEDDG